MYTPHTYTHSHIHTLTDMSRETGEVIGKWPHATRKEPFPLEENGRHAKAPWTEELCSSERTGELMCVFVFIYHTYTQSHPHTITLSHTHTLTLTHRYLEWNMKHLLRGMIKLLLKFVFFNTTRNKIDKTLKDVTSTVWRGVCVQAYMLTCVWMDVGACVYMYACMHVCVCVCVCLCDHSAIISIAQYEDVTWRSGAKQGAPSLQALGENTRNGQTSGTGTCTHVWNCTMYTTVSHISV